jgi:acyl carrier protein
MEGTDHLAALASSSSIIISEDAEKIRTVQDAVDYIRKHAKGGK